MGWSPPGPGPHDLYFHCRSSPPYWSPRRRIRTWGSEEGEITWLHPQTPPSLCPCLPHETSLGSAWHVNQCGIGRWDLGGSYPPLTPTNWRLLRWVAELVGSSFRFMMERTPAWGPPRGCQGVAVSPHLLSPARPHPGPHPPTHAGGSPPPTHSPHSLRLLEGDKFGGLPGSGILSKSLAGILLGLCQGGRCGRRSLG